ncbi:cytochrome P450 [Candidatus Poriferisocius sp.]|uniref:cytochrome P450 n=1 Tax=Candidatus Poriferisocius sp. TaxID=3101276 RepID=UPI003B012426
MDKAKHYRAHLDPFAEDPVLNDSYWDIMRDLRENCPVAHSDARGGFWILTRYEDVLAADRDWETFCSNKGVGVVAPTEGTPRLPPIEVDGPDHREWRRFLNPHFTHEKMSMLAPPAAGIANHLIDKFEDAGECDLVEDYARAFSTASFFELMIGTDRSELPRVLDITRRAIFERGDPVKVQEGRAELAAWVRNKLDQRRDEEPQGDLVDVILRETRAGSPLSADEQVQLLSMLIGAAMDTTTTAISIICRHLAENAEVRERLAGDPSQIGSSVDEFLRLESPVTHLARVTTREVVVGETTIPEGERVALYFSAANRDPVEFENPDTLQFDRLSNRHLSFGAGPHRCLGVHFARMQIEVAIATLLSRIPDFRVRLGSSVPYYTMVPRGPIEIPVEFASHG